MAIVTIRKENGTVIKEICDVVETEDKIYYFIKEIRNEDMTPYGNVVNKIKKGDD